MTNIERLRELYSKNGLSEDDVFKHKFYTIITRSGIDKIQAKNNIHIHYEVVKCEPNFAVIKAEAEYGGQKIETYGSALQGTGKNGTTQSWYVTEMAEKRAMSRAVLKLTGFYQLGAFGEDEADDFKKKEDTPTQAFNKRILKMKADLDTAKETDNPDLAISVYDEANEEGIIQVLDYYYRLFDSGTEGM